MMKNLLIRNDVIRSRNLILFLCFDSIMSLGVYRRGKCDSSEWLFHIVMSNKKE